jgi:hypothetical protein
VFPQVHVQQIRLQIYHQTNAQVALQVVKAVRPFQLIVQAVRRDTSITRLVLIQAT